MSGTRKFYNCSYNCSLSFFSPPVSASFIEKIVLYKILFFINNFVRRNNYGTKYVFVFNTVS